jgi:hypothetical protein
MFWSQILNPGPDYEAQNSIAPILRKKIQIIVVYIFYKFSQSSMIFLHFETVNSLAYVSHDKK